jgi:HAMP domain-containing protein
LTYIYTIVPSGGNWIRYVIDPTEGREHTNIGWPDLLTDEHTHGVQRVIEHRDVYLSGIYPWERWGLLKTAYAPIYSHKDGESRTENTGSNSERNTVDVASRAVAGMDINIDVIQTRTRSALTTVGCVAVTSLLLCSFTAFIIARQLTQPIAKVKDAAIEIASGEYSGRINVQKPRELAELATEFNRMSGTLAGRLRTMEEENRKIARQRCLMELDRSLVTAQVGPMSIDFPLEIPSAIASPITVSNDRRMAFFVPRNGNRSGTAAATAAERDRSNYILSPDGTKALLWFCDAVADPSEAVRRHADLTIIATRVLSHSGSDSVVISLLEPLLSEQIYGWVLIDSAYDTIASATNRVLNAHGFSPDENSTGGTEKILPEMPSRLVLAEGTCLILRSECGGLVATVSGRTSHGRENASDAETCLKAILPRSIWESVPPSETMSPEPIRNEIGEPADRNAK